MVPTPLTLAALATSAVPCLDVSGFQVLNPGNDNEDSVVLDTTRGRLLVQLPRTPEAEVHHSAKMMGQAALTAGVRESLPFLAPEVLGVTRSGDTRAVVSTFIDGNRFEARDLAADAELLVSVAATLSAIHDLPVQTVTQQGLPNRTMQDVRSEHSRLIERAAATGFLPELIKTHWLTELADQPLWDAPVTVVHGTFSSDTVLVAEERIIAVLDWSGLAVDDPARDFAWLCGAAPGALEAALTQYASGASERTVAALARRARFTHELEVAKWLLYGTERNDKNIIDDAIALLDQLVELLESHRLNVAQANDDEHAARRSTLDDAESALAQTPENLDEYPTDRFDALDDDRVFSSNGDFADSPDSEQSSADSKTQDEAELDETTGPVANAEVNSDDNPEQPDR